MTNATALARELADLRRRLAAVERAAQLPRTSIEGGALTVNDAEGTPVLSVGAQPDGSYAVTGTNGGQVVATGLDLPAGSITETDIDDDSISTPKLRANVITADKIAAGAVAADKIAANAVTAGKIAAGAVTADRLAVGGIGGEMIPDGSFESADLRVTRAINGYAFDTGSATPRSHGAAFAYRTADNPNTGTKKMTLASAIPVTAGDVYTTSVSLLTRNGANGQGKVSAAITKQDGTTAFVTLVAPADTPTAWTTYTGQATIPAGAVSMRVDLEITPAHTVGDWCFDAVSVRRVLPGVEIADGAITAAKIAAGAITAAKLDANAITGKTITGGMFYTAGALPRIEMGEQTYEGGNKASIVFNQTGNGWDEAVIQVSGAAGSRQFMLRGPSATGGSKGAWLRAIENQWGWNIHSFSDVSGLAGTVADFDFTPQGLAVTVPPSANGKSVTLNHGYVFYADNAGSGGGNTRLWLDTPGLGEVIVGPRAGGNFLGSFKIRTDATTASAANMFIDATTFQVKRSTSSLQYKTEVEDVTFDPEALRQLRPVRFRDKGEVAELGDVAPHYVGLIAEEVDALGLTEFVAYKDGAPDSVQYDRIVVGLLQMVADLERKVDALRATVAELTPVT